MEQMKASAWRVALVSAVLVGCGGANTAASSFADALVLLLLAVVGWFVLLVALFAVLFVQRVRQRPSRFWGITAAVVGAISLVLAVSWIQADLASGIAAMLGSVVLVLLGVSNARMVARMPMMLSTQPPPSPATSAPPSRTAAPPWP